MSAPTTGGTIYSNWQESAPATDPVGFGTDITGAGGTANGFDASGSNNASLYTHNNLTATWQAVTSTTGTNLNAGDPYRIFVRGDRTVNQASNSAPATNTILRSTGALTTGNVSVFNLNPAAGGFSLVGNPYQATVNMEEVLNDDDAFNLNSNFYYVWDPTLNSRGAYVTVNLESNTPSNLSSDANKYLQPNQAFFVQTQAIGPAGFTFKEEHKYSGAGTATPNLYKTTDSEPVVLNLALYSDANFVSGGPAADGLVVRFADSYSNEVDAFDAVKPVNQDENVGLLNNGTTLSFESRAMPLNGETLTLANTAYRGTAYTYKVTTGNFGNVTAYLNDAFLGTSTQLQNNAETLYNFNVLAEEPASSAANRFTVVFQATPLFTGTVTTQNAVVYPNPSTGGSFTVKLPAEGAATVNIYNQLGQRVANTASVSGNIIAVQPQTTLAAGIYLVEVNAGDNVYTQKLIVNN
jgi:hypothetical protein